MRPQLPASLQAGLDAVATHPLRTLLERLLRRRPARQEPERWLEAVLAAYMAAVVLPGQASPTAAAAAEQHLLAALGALQLAAAAQGLLQAAAQQAAAAAAAQLRWSGRSSSDAHEAQRRALLAEALQHLTSPACLGAAAAAQLLAQRAQQLAAPQPQADQPQERAHAAPAAALACLLHSPPTQLEVELLCYVALLRSWEAMLVRLAGIDAPCSLRLAGSSASGSSDAAQQAQQLLCSACSTQPQAVLAQHPALLAEVCRASFRFAAAYAPLLAGQLVAAADDTRSAAEAAQWRAAHATKHADHVSDFLRAKLCAAAGAAAGEHAGQEAALLCA